ncbi:hypothetical protein N7533_012961 [Penicillium manginii]|uniref:uncharacterized protein n=1 Tax=Penicillium manginii TaxID=203109 RepID=UPI002549B735|nr:uncharacterized protein N7533_012961 [Penicillium manginii]KAJ5734558.1 hypothetical protein N7533_012961 [Penicillium manginii]
MSSRLLKHRNHIAISGNEPFTLPGSYLSLSCYEFSLAHQNLSSFTTTRAPLPDISKIAASKSQKEAINTRLLCARTLKWESADWIFARKGDEIDRHLFTRATCDLTTTFVDVKVTCTGGSSSNSASSICTLSSVRRSPTPPVDSYWTVLDLGRQSGFSQDDTSAVRTVINELFPTTKMNGGQEPIISYLINPLTAVGGYQAMTVHLIGRSVFETCLDQILNLVLYLGIESTAFTGSFNGLESSYLPITTQQYVVKCNRAWLGVLIAASLGIFLFAAIGVILRIMTFAPDVLGSVSAVFLNNRITGVTGSSTWSSDDWAICRKDEKLYLGDVALR